MTSHQSADLVVTQLWRYPVKSLRGESLPEARLTRDGVPGDRAVHVRGPRGLLTGRTRHPLLTLQASTGPDGEPLVEGHRWDSAEAARLVRQAAGEGTSLVRDDAPQRFDVLPLLVATDAEIDRLGVDGRRLRPNIVVGGAAELAERDWPGQALRIGEALIGVLSLRARCIVTTIDPDSGQQDLDVLRRIRRDFDGSLALDCWVISPGVTRVGDRVTVVPMPQPLPAGARPAPGGWVTGRRYPSAVAPLDAVAGRPA